jgi:hypothetical protein
MVAHFFGLIVVLRAHIVRVILGTGAFDWDATLINSGTTCCVYAEPFC